MTVGTGRLSVSIAGPEDDADLRGLLRDTPVEGAVSVSFAREPSYFHAAAVEGDAQTVIAREPDGRLVAAFTRSVRPRWVGGAQERCAYLSALRVHPRYRLRPALLRLGFERARELHQADAPILPYALTTIADENKVARRILEANLPGLPRYRAVDELLTFTIPTWRRRHRTTASIEVRDGREEDWEELLALQERWGRRHRFAPVWDRATLTDPARARNLAVGDFSIAFKNGRPAGCVALWDQNGFKQTLIQGYSRLLARLRGALNVAAPLFGLPRVPGPGEPLRHAWFSHLAVDDDDVDVARALLTFAHDRSLRWGYGYVLTMLAARHPLVPVVRSLFTAMSYRSRLYTVSWRPSEPPPGISHIEAATL